jgi:hypothetical protein
MSQVAVRVEPAEASIEDDLGVYAGDAEPLSGLLRDRLHLSPLVVGALAVLAYLGVLTLLHTLAGTPRPTTLAQALSPPAKGRGYYYPNLDSVVFDLVGNPLLLFLLVAFRDYLPAQFRQLERNGVIVRRPVSPWVAKLVRLEISGRRRGFRAVYLGLLGAALVVAFFSPAPGQLDGALRAWTFFLVALGAYTRLAVLLQVSYVLLIWRGYSLELAHLNLLHADRCGGVAPLGNLAIAAYSFLFALATLQGVDLFAGQALLKGVLGGDLGSALGLALWLLFVVALLLVFERLVYRPHRAMEQYQAERLSGSGQAWSDYHRHLGTRLAASLAQRPGTAEGTPGRDLQEDLELLAGWYRLNQYIADLHTWPIPRPTLRLLAVLVNPLIPLLVPVLVRVLQQL